MENEIITQTKPKQNSVEEKSRIILISGENGRNCGRYLNNLTNDRFNITVVTKPNVNISELLQNNVNIYKKRQCYTMV